MVGHHMRLKTPDLRHCLFAVLDGQIDGQRQGLASNAEAAKAKTLSLLW